MAVNFVIGPASSGKSHFIKEVFPNSTVIDLYDFQKGTPVNVASVMDSYKKAEEALIEAVKKEKNVVLEHTLLRAIRRKPYIEAVKKVTDEPINCYVIKPSMKKFKEYCKKRKLNYKYEKEAFDVLEIPTKDEGFANIYIIKSI